MNPKDPNLMQNKEIQKNENTGNKIQLWMGNGNNVYTEVSSKPKWKELKSLKY